jgi:NAD(P)-dependent dehydrogenase (short-subunit alcohol dehydrogenase family)
MSAELVIGRRFAGQVILVTGGGRGLGRAIAMGFAREGGKVVLASRTESELRETSRLITQLPGTVEPFLLPTDVTDGEQVRRLVEIGIVSCSERL